MFADSKSGHSRGQKGQDPIGGHDEIDGHAQALMGGRGESLYPKPLDRTRGHAPDCVTPWSATKNGPMERWSTPPTDKGKLFG